MKLIFVDNSLRMFCNFRLDVIKYFVKKGHTCIICYPKSTEEIDLLETIPVGIKLHSVQCKPSGITPQNDLIYFYSLLSFYQKEKPDIIFHYTIKPNIYGTLAAKILGIKCIDMVAGLGYIFTGNSIKKKIGRILYKFSLRRADYVITLNQTIYDLLIKEGYVPQNKIELFKCGEGVNFNKYFYKKNSFEKIHFLMIARVLYDKGYSEFVEASSIIKEKYPTVECELLGSLDKDSPMGVPASILEQDVKEGKIKYLGVSYDVPSIIGRNGVVVTIPSCYPEGLNRALMEACAMARPIITSNIAGCRETVDEGINGFLVQKKDTQSLVKAMIKFIELEEDKKIAMSEASYNKAQKTFSIDIVLGKYDNILKKLTSSFKQ